MSAAPIASNEAEASKQDHDDGEPPQLPQSPHVIQWWLAIKSSNKTTLHLLSFSEFDTGMTVMHALKDEYKRMKQTFSWYHSHPQIEEAVVSLLCIGDLEAQNYPRQVLIESSVPRPDLTEAFHNPAVLQGAEFLSLTHKFAVSLDGRQRVGSRRAILIKTEISNYWAYLVLVAAVLFAVGIGIAAGFWKGSVAVGLATSGGFVGVLALAQAFVFGMELGVKTV